MASESVGETQMHTSQYIAAHVNTVEPDTFGTRPKRPVYRSVHISGVPRNVDTWGIGQSVQYIIPHFSFAK